MVDEVTNFGESDFFKSKELAAVTKAIAEEADLNEDIQFIKI